MRNFGWLVPGILAGALSLAGCSGSAPVRYADGAAPAAEGASTNVHVDAGTKGDLAATIAAVDKEMQPGGRWQYVTAKDREAVSANFAKMQQLFDKYGTIDNMDGHARQRMLDAQNNINAILTHDDGNRLICEFRRPIGSHLPVKTCKTYAELKKRERDEQDDLLRRRQLQPPPPPCGIAGAPSC
jgi:hypothetical protein